MKITKAFLIKLATEFMSVFDLDDPITTEGTVKEISASIKNEVDSLFAEDKAKLSEEAWEYVTKVLLLTPEGDLPEEEPPADEPAKETAAEKKTRLKAEKKAKKEAEAAEKKAKKEAEKETPATKKTPAADKKEPIRVGVRRLVVKGGKTKQEIADELGVPLKRVSDWIAMLQNEKYCGEGGVLVITKTKEGKFKGKAPK